MAAPTLLTYGPGNVDETLTLSMVNMMPGIKDNIFNKNDALEWFYNKNKKKMRGGTSLSHAIHYAKAETSGGSYQRYDLLSTLPADNLTRDQWTWAQYAQAVTIDGFTERIANKGDSALEDALEEKKSEAEMTMRDRFERHLFASSPGTKDIRPLPSIVLGSGTEGQINGTANSWWQSTVVASGSWASGVGRAQTTNLINTISKRNPTGNPEVLMSDQTSYEAYEGSLVSQYRYESDTPDIGAKKLTFKNIPWIWSVQGTSGVVYALTSAAIEFIVNSDTDFIMKPFQSPVDQDAKVGQILVACTLATGVRRKLGKSTGNAT